MTFVKLKCIPATSTVSSGKVTTLDHKIWNNSVELGALVSLALGLLGQLEEVVNGLGNSLTEETDGDPTGGFIPNADVEPNLVGNLKSKLYETSIQNY